MLLTAQAAILITQRRRQLQVYTTVIHLPMRITCRMLRLHTTPLLLMVIIPIRRRHITTIILRITIRTILIRQHIIQAIRCQRAAVGTV